MLSDNLTLVDIPNLPGDQLAEVAFRALHTLRDRATVNISQVPIRLHLELKLWRPQYSREIICLRDDSRTGIEVLLVSLETRPLDDIFKQRGCWYNPGSFPLYAEAEGEHWLSIEKRFGISYAGMPRFVGHIDNPDNWQGHTLHIIYCVTLKEGQSGNGQWFPIDTLPADTLPWHKKMIELALPLYREYSEDERLLEEIRRDAKLT